MPRRSIKPGSRVSAIHSYARADIPVLPVVEGSPPALLFGRVKGHAPPPSRSWVVVWEIDSKETTIAAQRLTLVDGPIVPINADDIKEIAAPEAPLRRAAAPRYLIEDIGSDEDESEWEEYEEEEVEEKKEEAKLPDDPLSTQVEVGPCY